MGLDWFTPQHLSAEWRVLTSAPLLTLGLIVAMLGLGYLAAKWRFDTRIEHLEERLRLRDDQLKAAPAFTLPALEPAIGFTEAAITVASPTQAASDLVPPSPHKNYAPRAFTDQLTKMLKEGAPEPKRNAFLRLQAGNWVRLSGEFYTCSVGTTRTTIWICLDPEDWRGHATVYFPPGASDLFAHLDHGSPITVEAQIIEKKPYVDLANGELL